MKKRILSILLICCMVFSLFPVSALAANDDMSFTDVKTTDWFYKEVCYVYDEGLMQGTSATTFDPNLTTSRGMIVTILYRLEGEPSLMNDNIFTDVEPGSWYEKGVVWANGKGIVEGYGNGKFRPNDPITREQLATIMYRYANYKGYDTATKADLSDFVDSGKISSYALDAMKWANAAGLINGVGASKLDPQGDATRAQVAAIFYRFCNEYVTEKTYTVTFDLNYGSDSTYATQNVKSGERAAQPTAPKRSGYTFMGWYTKDVGGSKFDFGTAITADLTLYAHWAMGGGYAPYTPTTPSTYTVTFDMQGHGGTAPQAITNVQAGSTITAPTAPTEENYSFYGWFKDEDCTDIWNFAADEVEADMTLYAGWVDARYLIFTAEEDNSSVRMVDIDWNEWDESYGWCDQNGNWPLVEYSTNEGATWNTYDFSENAPIPLENAGDQVYFRGNNPEGFGWYDPDEDDVYFVYYEMEGTIAASGSVMALIDPSGATTEIPSEYCFYELFTDCESLTSAPALPAMTLADDCYEYMFENCTSLKTAPVLPAMTLAPYCYCDMFDGCEALETAPVLPATELAEDCYENMFWDCTSLETAPDLPATTMKESCYNCMFYGCESLTNAPELSAMTLADSCYSSMFENCESLETAPALPATTMADSCYYQMFSGCESLTNVPDLPATTMAECCYQEMFYGCTALVNAPAIAATTMATRCCYWMFQDCTALENVPDLPATDLTDGFSCYSYMFQNCTSLENAPALPATTVEENCYCSMFSGCTSLENAPALPATDLTDCDYCYEEMFCGCENLVTAPALPATTLADNCYEEMFSGCTSLENAPALPATTLTYCCYYEMFSGCTNLENAPEISAETMADHCCWYMFNGCTSLENAPELSAMTLADSCYANMFDGCTSLETAPALPATTLANSCYNCMFSGCTSLTAAPVLAAETLETYCYYGIFMDCSSLSSVTMLATDVSASECLSGWLYNAAEEGTLYLADLGMVSPLDSKGYIPLNWTPVAYSA